MSIVVIVSALLGIMLAWYLVRLWRLRALSVVYKQNFPEEWEVVLQRNVPLVSAVPAGLQLRLRGLISVFIFEKQFVGCDGLEITDEMRVTIAAQACILYLNRTGYAFPRLKTIFVYPMAYVADVKEQQDGATSRRRSVRAGESWVNGPIVLSWADSKQGAANVYDGKNVVMHEFAHKLDEQNAGMDGLPVLNQTAHYQPWARILGREFNKLQRKVSKKQKTVVDYYGATSPAEYFAVVTETFFEKPAQLKKARPELYRQLKQFYQLDPVMWSAKQIH